MVEVADTFIEKPPDSSAMTDKIFGRYGGRVTPEEVLDAIFQTIPAENPQRA